MTHDEALTLLTARIAGELTPTQEQALQLWIGENPDHRILAEAFQMQDAELRQTFEPRREAAAITAERVVAALPDAARPDLPMPRTRPSIWRALIAPVAAAAMLAAVVLFWIKPPIPNPTAPPDLARAGDATTNDGLKAKPKPEAPKAIALAVGDAATTRAGEKRRVALPDGSIVYLNEKTSVELTQDRRLKLAAGEVFVEATEANADRGRFAVETPDKTVTALGTKFEVRANDKGTGVLVTQGKVEVTGLQTAITTGHELALGTTDILTSPRASYALDWTRDLMIAAESPLVPAGKYHGGALVAVDPYGQEAKLSLVKYRIDVHVEDGFARTTIDQTYFNYENFQMEGTFYFPLPPDASLSRLAMYVSNGEESVLMEGGMAERNHARQTYETIRYARRDPALLEWVDGSLFKMRVFPLEGRQEKRIVLSYSQKLPVSYGRTSYRFPSGHSLNVVRDWSFHAFIKEGAKLSAVSPSHPDMKIEHRGGDLELTDRAENIKADKDVVIDLYETNPNATPAVRWSSAEQDGRKYLMMRYRPQLPGLIRRERRDWVILFEASGARDPLTARAQIEILRTLLNNAEHDDTFALLTVGTRIRKFAEQPMPVSPDNLAAAMTFLERTQLIGALDLEGALKEAQPWLSAGQNPHLVHLGGGVPTLGEQRADKLIPLLPPGVRYVGVGVGKRVSPAFMKPAAEKTGGLFAQINPDEPIAWRSFELASTLNTPRLLNVTVSAGENMPRFLTFTNALAHGEELAAVARIDNAALTGVTVRGLLDGQTFEQTVPVQEIAPEANYLPRTWAKLEIDRLMADDVGRHRQAITELSKAMYVMTPFTSLLVLENEAMYKEFKIDRGRKDHWAMYACPTKMPTVYIPDPNQPAGTAMQRIHQKPHANEVLQTILCRTMPRYLSWPNINRNDVPVQTAGQFYGNGAFAVPELGPLQLRKFRKTAKDRPQPQANEDLINTDAGLDPEVVVTFEEMGALQVDTERVAADGVPLGVIGVDFDGSVATNGKPPQQFFMHQPVSLGYERLSGAIGAEDDAPLIINGTQGRAMLRRNLPEFGFGENLGRQWRGENSRPQLPALSDGSTFDVARGLETDWFERTLADATANLGDYRYGIEHLGLNVQAPPGRPQGSFMIGAGVRSTPSLNSPLPIEGTYRSEPLDDFILRLQFSPSKAEPEAKSAKRPESLRKARLKQNERIAENRIFGMLQGKNSGPTYYGRPSFSGLERVFTDLLAYAPGMTSLPADVQAVLEAEAAPRFGNRRGEVTPAAKILIDRARTAHWQVTRFGKDQSFAITHDGQGRFSYERKLPFGLRERVVCDGATLWRLYPELGIGAQRVVSRFHRAELSSMLPDVLPPADDMTVGADVVGLNDRTVAIVPLESNEPDEEDRVQGWVEVHLVFDDNRLAERRTVLLLDKNLAAEPARQEKKDEAKKLEPVARSPRAEKFRAIGRLLSREVYAADGGIQVLDAAGKELAADKRHRTPTQAADVAPDLKELVVLPLPFRNRATIYPKYDLNPSYDLDHEENACFAVDLTPEATMEVLAADLMENRLQSMNALWTKNFHERGDRRRGFYTLLAAAGDTMQTSSDLSGRASANPHDPLLRYLFLLHDSRFSYYQARIGIYTAPETPDDFLNNLLTFRALSLRWRGNAVNDPLLGSRASERRRALAFATRHADTVWGWCTLSMVSDQAYTPEFRKQLAAGWGVLAEKSGLTYYARYEQARQLWQAGRSDDAEAKFIKLFEETLAQGILPPLDDAFRTVLECNGRGDWSSLMNTQAMQAIRKHHRSLAVLLAWQAKQLGDQPLADRLIQLALADVSPEEKTPTTIAAIEYVWGINEPELADRLLHGLLDDSTTAKSPLLWRLSSMIAERRGRPLQQYADLERALDLEFPRMPETFDLETVRRDYGQLLNHYQWLADASVSLKVPPPADLVTKTIRYADRWRSLDPEVTGVCDRTAKILRTIGGDGAAALSWDYLTTPLALKPNESAPWLSLAETAKREGDWSSADRCYREAFAAEPTNAQILWDRAQLLQRYGRESEARKVMQQIAETTWQPRFEGVKMQARQIVGAREAGSKE